MTTVAEVLNRLAGARDQKQFANIWTGYSLTIRRQEKRHGPVNREVLVTLLDLEKIIAMNGRKGRHVFSRVTELNGKQWR